jgi:SnoaL-like domain
LIIGRDSCNGSIGGRTQLLIKLARNCGVPKVDLNSVASPSLLVRNYHREEGMKSTIRVVASILLTLSAVVSLHAQKVERQGTHPTKEIVQPKRLSKNELFSQGHTADVVAIDQVWSAYAYYNDTHDGPGVSSLFTKDAIVHFVRNDRGKLELMNDGGCRLIGQKDIAAYFGFNRTTKFEPEIREGLPFPGNSHHFIANKMVKVNDDGKTAMLTATLLYTAVSSDQDRLAGPDGKGSRIASSGEYRIFFRKTSEGWQIAEFYLAGDSTVSARDVPSTNANSNCDLNGPIPRPAN